MLKIKTDIELVKPDLSKQQIKNLRKLAAYLPRVPQSKFGMGFYSTDSDRRRYSPTHCGTIGCACGYGPIIGIAPKSKKESWTEYQFRCFVDGEAGHWCFSGGWEDYDNTPAGAAARILFMLDHGYPEEVCFVSEGEDYVKLYAPYTRMVKKKERERKAKVKAAAEKRAATLKAKQARKI